MTATATVTDATDTPCAGCPSPILAGAPRVDDPPFGQHTEASWHPGCWAAEQRRQRARP